MIKPNLLLNLNSYYLLKNHQKTTPNNLGFALIEVLVTILVVTGFILGSLQATVLATYIRVNAQDKQGAINWIQQDLELINYRAFILDPNPNYPSTPGSKAYNSDPTACTNLTYGSRLQSSSGFLTAFPATQTVDIGINKYNVTRTYTPKQNTLQVEYLVAYASGHPRYKGATGDNELATLSTEVLINAVLDCNK